VGEKNKTGIASEEEGVAEAREVNGEQNETSKSPTL